jgi:hypothetical protein
MAITPLRIAPLPGPFRTNRRLHSGPLFFDITRAIARSAILRPKARWIRQSTEFSKKVGLKHKTDAARPPSASVVLGRNLIMAVCCRPCSENLGSSIAQTQRKSSPSLCPGPSRDLTSIPWECHSCRNRRKLRQPSTCAGCASRRFSQASASHGFTSRPSSCRLQWAHLCQAPIRVYCCCCEPGALPIGFELMPRGIFRQRPPKSSRARYTGTVPAGLRGSRRRNPAKSKSGQFPLKWIRIFPAPRVSKE